MDSTNPVTPPGRHSELNPAPARQHGCPSGGFLNVGGENATVPADIRGLREVERKTLMLPGAAGQERVPVAGTSNTLVALAIEQSDRL